VRIFLYISIGAVVGANLRYLMAQLIGRLLPSAFPFGTLFINISASFVLGWFVQFALQRSLADPRWRALIAVGFCGGYSTYSSYAVESFALLENGQWGLFSMNILAMNIACLLAVAAGAAFARAQ
jgi:fluoride exporter